MHFRRKSIGAVLAGVLLLAVAAAASPFTSAKGYQITAAPGWKVNHSGMMGSDVIIYTASAGGFAPNLNVVVTKVGPGETVDTDRPQLNAMYTRTFHGYKQLSESIITVSGVRAINIVATQRPASPPHVLRMHQVLAIKNGTAYIFTCTTLDSNHAKYDPAFTSMLKSVRWTK